MTLLTVDKRYGSRRWKATRLRVLARDLYRCQVVAGCPREARVCDHISPVGPDTSDAEFYGEGGLRAACMFHNTRRGHVDAFARELDGGTVARAARSYGFSVGAADVQ